MTRYKIGIVGWKTGDNSFGVSVPYLNFISYFGGQAIILPPQYAEEVDESLDLVIMPGGPDIDTARYNELPDFNGSKPCPHREHFDKVMLQRYIEAGVPIFGICRGFQSLAVHFGGKLIQHMYHETNDHDRQKLVHNVYIDDRILKIQGLMGVNSIHHQAFNHESEQTLLDAGFNITASHRSFKKKEVDYPAYPEAFVHPDLLIAAVQWHPEEIYDNYSLNLVESLITKATI